MFAIIDTPTITENTCYLNHAYLSKGGFGSEDMAWTTDNLWEARDMSARLEAMGKYANVIEL
jgi:hypothetical protein